MRRGARAWSILVVAIAGWSLATACSDDREQRPSPSSTESSLISDSAVARERLGAIRHAFRAPSPEARPAAPPAGLPKMPESTDRAAIEPGVASIRAADDGQRHRVEVARESTEAGSPTARVELPSTAAGEFVVEDQTSHVSVGVSLEGATNAPMLAYDGVAFYPGALGDGVDAVQRPSASGNEDFVVFERRPDDERLRYRIDVSKVAGLRLVGGVLELLDEQGAPRLRMAPPYVQDSNGARQAAKVELEGCAVDTSPVAPWGRPVIPPGSDSCRVSVSWDGHGMSYPLLVDPTWTSTGSMAYQRAYHPALMLLANGKALIAGGYGCTPSCTYVGPTELYDRTTGTWATTGSLNNPRYYTSGVPLASSNALVAGGYGSTGYLQTAERYDPSTGAWTLTGSMATTRYLLTTTLMANGKVLAAGGYGATGYLYSSEVFDPATNAWTSAGNMPNYRYQHTASLLSNGKVLVAGGYPTTDTTAFYDPTANTWTAGPTMTTARYGHESAVFASGGKVLVAGGYTSTGYQNTAEVFSVATGAWAKVADMLVTHAYGFSATLANGKILVGGGYSCTPSCTYSNKTEVYDPTGNTWSDTGDMKDTRYRPPVNGVLLSTGEVLIAGGYGASGYLNTAELFKLVAQGGPCGATGECASGYCVDGVCCNTACTGLCQACTGAKKGGGLNGVCGTIANGTDPDSECADQGAFSCGTTGVCNGSGACALYTSGTQCGNPSCSAGNLSTYACNGGGACLTNQTSCAPYICGSTTACRTNCTSDSHCVASAYCRTSDGTCQFDLPSGSACTGASQCASGYCVDGVCCSTACTGLCQACSVAKKGSGVDGECGAIKDGSDPDAECTDQGAASCQNDGQCNGAGACRKYAKGTSCGATTCVGNNATGQVCDGFGSCVTDTTGTDCSPYLCKSSACANPCANDLDCVSGNFCESGTCKAKQANGATCGGANACISGYCVDGVCCNSACTGLCQACSVTKKGGGTGGDCGPIKTGTDPDSECAATAKSTCGTDGSCNGAGACRVWAKGTVCGADVCVGNSQTGKSCDGFGTCGNNASGTDCTPYVCSSGACQSPCTTDANCTSGNFCKSGVCTPKQANGAVCGGTNQCQSGYCVDGVCCATACTGNCQACSAATKGNGVDGECGPVSNGTDPDNDCPDDGAASCKRDGTCNGFGACSQYSKGTACGSSACIGNKVSGQFCDGFGSCQYDPVGTDCAPYVCAANKCSSPCAADTDCTAGNYCDSGTCKGKQVNGSSCGGNNECASNYCVDGVCCATSCTGLCQACSAGKKGSGVDGECGPIADNSDPDLECPDDGTATCKRDGMCNGFGACRLYVKSTACGTTQCVGNSVKGQVCDGLGSCVVDTTGTDCSPYVCSGNACANPCSTNLDCLPGNFCDAGSCKSKLSNGAVCATNADCQSSYCVDGVCCATACTGVCQACSAAKKGTGVDGECEPVKDGTDPDDECPDDGAATCKRDGACNGSGLCRYYAKGTTCKANTTTCVGNFAKGYLCDGLGTCEYEPTGTDCSPHLCLNNQCANPCTADTDCVTGNFCDTGSCKAKLPNGQQCTAGTQCSSGFCVDGVCCDSACTGQCEACDVSPNEGTCSPAMGAPHGTRPACKGAGGACDGVCDGVNASACVYPGSSTSCGTACENGNVTPSFCDGNGTCSASTAKSCSPYVCGTDDCLTSCDTKADCASGYTCASDKKCIPLGTTCSDDHTLSSPDGTSKDCSPFKCELDSCKSSCQSIDDCVSPAVCRASDNTCAPPAAGGFSDDSAGCGCSVPGTDPSRPAGFFALALAALSLARRRRQKTRGRRERRPSNCGGSPQPLD